MRDPTVLDIQKMYLISKLNFEAVTTLMLEILAFPVSLDLYNPFATLIDDSAKGGLTQFGELFTVIPCAHKDFKR